MVPPVLPDRRGKSEDDRVVSFMGVDQRTLEGEEFIGLDNATLMTALITKKAHEVMLKTQRGNDFKYYLLVHSEYPGPVIVSGTTLDGTAKSKEELPTTPTLPVSEPPVIQASANTYSGAAVLPVKFSCSVSEGVGPYLYSWDFDAWDGQQVDKYHRDATFVFAEAGTYRVTLTVTDSLGQEVFDTLDIEVFPQEVVRGSPVILLNQHGTDENPIIIEELEISTTEGSAINLVHCSHAIIRNNFIHDLSSQGTA